MANDGFNGMKLPDTFKLDLTHTTNLTSGIQAQMEENNRRIQKAGEEAYNNRQGMQNNIEKIAMNTAETNLQLQKVV